MTTLLSIIVAIAMLMTGATGTEPTGNSSTLENIVLSINDQVVELDPTITTGLLTADNAAVLDFFMTAGDSTIFPYQLAIDSTNGFYLASKNGNETMHVSVDTLDAMLAAMGFDMETIFTEAINSEAMQDIYDVMNFMVGTFVPDYITVTEYLTTEGGTAFGEALTAALMENITITTLDTTTANWNGVDHEATGIEITVTDDQIAALLDSTFGADENVKPLYNDIFAFANLLNEKAGKTTAYVSAADVLANMNTIADLDTDIVIRSSEDGYYGIDVTLNVTSEGTTVPLFFTYNAYDAVAAAALICSDDENAFALDYTSTSTEDGMIYTFTSTIDENGTVSQPFSLTVDTLNEQFNIDFNVDMGDACNMAFEYNMYAGGERYAFALTSNGITIPLVIENYMVENGEVLTMDCTIDSLGGLKLNVTETAIDETTVNEHCAIDLTSDFLNVSLAFDVNDSTALFDTYYNTLNTTEITADTDTEAMTAELTSLAMSAITDAGTLMEDASVQNAISFFSVLLGSEE